MAFHLFCLGTDTTYTPGADYLATAPFNAPVPLQETLSTVAQCIQAPENPNPLWDTPNIRQHADIHVIHAQSVVLDGPDTTGQLVHDKIAKGLICVLNAIMMGETHINIVGFSRGSVQSIHITHELQRIVMALRALETHPNTEQLLDIICNSTIQWRKNHLNDHHRPALKNAITEAHITALMRILSPDGEPLLHLHVFALDPVSGMEGTDKSLLDVFTAPIRWSSEQHYCIPELVEQFVEIVHEDECSYGFRPVIPQAMSDKTKMVYLNLPGFHGTADGNPYNHNSPDSAQKNGIDHTKTRDAQILVFYKILDFLQNNQALLAEPKTESLDAPLDAPYAAFFRVKDCEIEKNKLLCAVYDHIAINKPMYRRCRNTTYIGMDVSRHHPERKVMGYLSKTRSLPLSRYIPFSSEATEHFVNQEHFYRSIDRILNRAHQKTQAEPRVVALRLIAFIDQLTSASADLESLLEQKHLDSAGIIETLIDSSTHILAKHYLQEQTAEADHAIIQNAMTRLLAQEGQDIEENKRAILKSLQTRLTHHIQSLLEQNLNDIDIHLSQPNTDSDEDTTESDRNDAQQTAVHHVTMLLYRLQRLRSSHTPSRINALDLLKSKLQGKQKALLQRIRPMTPHPEPKQPLLDQEDPTDRLITNEPPKHERPSLNHDGLTLSIISGFSGILGATAVALGITALVLSGHLLLPTIAIVAGTLLVHLGIFGLNHQSLRNDSIGSTNDAQYAG